jgi:hypothetical protein
MKILRSQLKQIIKEELESLNEELGMDQQGEAFSQILPTLMGVAGNNNQLAIEILEFLTNHLKETGGKAPVGAPGV